MKMILTCLVLGGIVVLMGGSSAGAVTYYVDSVAGSNEKSGRSAETAWADFTNINGKVLQPGDKLLIKCGSVINQELKLQAQGSKKAWVKIGPYGKGTRPVIRRNWDITDRCAKIENANCLKISGLTFCYAGKGLAVYAGKGQGNVIIEDCVAHHIEGIYGTPNMSGILEWRNYKPDWPPLSGGIMMAGGTDMTLRDCDIFQTSWGFFVANGKRVTIDAVNVHDSYNLNTSAHPSVAALTESVLKNSVFDAAGYHASRGTMGLMIGEPKNFEILNCTFRNQPDSGSHDQGGIDFEANGDGVLVDGCTFQNNAGPGVEVLGLNRPQPVNVTIRNSRFINNSSKTHKFPGEIYIFGHPNPEKRDPKIECSTGVIQNNGYVLNPGVEFYLDRSTKGFTDWKVQENREYKTVKALKKAMPLNDPPTVNAGNDIYTTVNDTVRLKGSVSDDRKPKTKGLQRKWEVLEGPGLVRFSDSSSPTSEAMFSTPGEYMLRLKGHDGELWTSDLLYVAVLASKTTLVKGWEFNGTLDKEGWTEASVGETGWPDPNHAIFSVAPVKYVTGGYYIVVVKDTAKAKLVSPSKLGISARKGQYLEVSMQNHTSAKQMKLSFIAAPDAGGDAAKSVAFDVIPNDKQVRVYRVDMSKVAGWEGTIDQLRLEPGAGEAITGTMRVDYVRLLERSK
ncbi:MAG: right-handed parallel beta-helix repeat-containing protein [Verrucomicrobia bacterium]|jgi:hypothetical protein|nr:right-handed parallel beta-helix repeat-containing protein [Verrucomicrobiota bacterium]